MTLAELMQRIKAIAPDAFFDEAGNGEVVVHTGLVAHPEADWEQPHKCTLTSVDSLM